MKTYIIRFESKHLDNYRKDIRKSQSIEDKKCFELYVTCTTKVLNNLATSFENDYMVHTEQLDIIELSKNDSSAVAKSNSVPEVAIYRIDVDNKNVNKYKSSIDEYCLYVNGAYDDAGTYSEKFKLSKWDWSKHNVSKRVEYHNKVTLVIINILQEKEILCYLNIEDIKDKKVLYKEQDDLRIGLRIEINKLEIELGKKRKLLNSTNENINNINATKSTHYNKLLKDHALEYIEEVRTNIQMCKCGLVYSGYRNPHEDDQSGLSGYGPITWSCPSN